MSRPSPSVLVECHSFILPGDYSDPAAVWHAFLESVHRTGVTVVALCHHVFPGAGLSGVVVIGESHAAIHTWPEQGRAWFELATCGDRLALDAFERECRRSFTGEGMPYGK